MYSFLKMICTFCNVHWDQVNCSRQSSFNIWKREKRRNLSIRKLQSYPVLSSNLHGKLAIIFNNKRHATRILHRLATRHKRYIIKKRSETAVVELDIDDQLGLLRWYVSQFCLSSRNEMSRLNNNTGMALTRIDNFRRNVRMPYTTCRIGPCSLFVVCNKVSWTNIPWKDWPGHIKLYAGNHTGLHYNHTGNDVTSYFRSDVIVKRTWKMQSPTIWRWTSREQFNTGPRNFLLYREQYATKQTPGWPRVEYLDNGVPKIN